MRFSDSPEWRYVRRSLCDCVVVIAAVTIIALIIVALLPEIDNSIRGDEPPVSPQNTYTGVIVYTDRVICLPCRRLAPLIDTWCETHQLAVGRDVVVRRPTPGTKGVERFHSLDRLWQTDRKQFRRWPEQLDSIPMLLAIDQGVVVSRHIGADAATLWLTERHPALHREVTSK